MSPTLIALLKGLALGLSIAAPVGPIGLLCIRRTLSSGWLLGLVTGLGAATADMLYGLVAAAGLTVVTELLVSLRTPLQGLGGAALVWLGVGFMRARPTAERAEARAAGLAAAYGVTLFLTLTNPATILSFAAVMASLGAIGASGRTAALVTGVFLGSALWWLALSTGVSLVRHRLSERTLRSINRISGATLALFGLAAIAAAAVEILA